MIFFSSSKLPSFHNLLHNKSVSAPMILQQSIVLQLKCTQHFFSFSWCYIMFHCKIDWVYKILARELKGTVPRKSIWALNVHFSYRRQHCYHLFGCETHANRAITTPSWDYLVYLRNLAVHKDHLPHHRMTSQSAEQLCNYDVI